MLKYFYRHRGVGYVLAGLCLISSSLYGREYWVEGREEIAQEEGREMDHNQHPLRMGDWDFRENWQYHRQAFFNGETQAEAVRKSHPYGRPGIGYDGDEDYLRERRERLRDRYSHRDHASEDQNRNR